MHIFILETALSVKGATQTTQILLPNSKVFINSSSEYAKIYPAIKCVFYLLRISIRRNYFLKAYNSSNIYLSYFCLSDFNREFIFLASPTPFSLF